MGLFSSKTIITTGTSISPLISEAPNIIRSAILRSTINNWEVVPTILDAVQTGYNVDPEGYYKFGESSYLEGLPSSTKLDFQFDADEVISKADLEFGGLPTDATITWEILNYMPITPEALAYKFCVIHLGMDKRGFGEEYGKIGYNLADLGVDMNTETAYVVSLDYFSESPLMLSVKILKYPTEKPDEKTYFIHTFTDTDNILQVVDITDLDRSVYLAKAFVVPNNTESGSYSVYFSYDPRRNTYPSLPNYVSSSLNSPYYPIGFVRRNGQNIQNGTSLYSSVQGLLDYAKVDLGGIQSALADNPDINLIDNSFVILGLPIGANHDINTTKSDPVLLKYLYYYLEYLLSVSSVDSEAFNTSLATGVPRLNTLRIADSTFRTDLYWSHVDIVYFPNPTYKGGFEVHFYTPQWDGEKGDNFHSKDAMTVVHYRKDSSVAIGIKITGLFHVSGVYQGKDVIYTLWDVLNPDPDSTSDGFFIPLHRDTMNRLSKRDYTYVTFKSLILLNYAVQKTKIKWYQKASFLKLIKIVTFIYSIVTINPSLTSIALNLATQVGIMILEGILINLVITPLMSFALKEIAKVVGGDFAEIAAIITLALAASYGANSFNLPFADTFLKTTTTLVGIEQKRLAEEFADLREEASEFKSEYDKLMQEIEEAKSTFTERGINALWFYGVNNTLHTESPSDFFNRSLSVDTNTSIEALSSFYDYKLKI